MMTTDAAFGRVVKKMIPHGHLLRAEQMKGGISAEVVRVEVGLPDGSVRRLVVRVPPPEPMPGATIHPAEHDYRVLESVVGAGVAAPRPLLLDMECDVLPTPYVVMEFMEGAADFALTGKSAAQLTHRMEQMAAQLARIHSIDMAAAGLNFLPDQMARVAWVLTQPRATPDHTMDEPHIRAHLSSAWAGMMRNPPVLLHGDLWPGNLLWQDDQLTGVLDWEDAAQGDPLFDVAVARLDLLWIFGEAGMHAFTQAYQAFRPQWDYSALPYWDLFAALRALPWLGEAAANWPALGRPDLTEAVKRVAHRRFTLRARQAIE